MNKSKENSNIKSLVIDFIKFGLVGVVNTFTSYVIVNTCHYALHIHEQISNIIAFIISVFVSFTLNGKFVFKNEDKSLKTKLKTLVKSYVSYSFTGLILTAILIEIECDRLGIPLYIASLLNLVITVPINFILNKFWAFRKMEKKLSVEELKKIKKLAKKHTFAICAYKESEYLEDCIKSVLNQEIKTNCLIATSTPNDKIKSLAKKYKIPYYIRDGKSDIKDDWNFAYNHAKTELVTIAHQDDVYEPNYTKELLGHYNEKALMYDSNFYPFKNCVQGNDINCTIKSIIKTLFRNKFVSSIKFFKMASLAFGNSINCPSVTYNKKLLGGKKHVMGMEDKT